MRIQPWFTAVASFAMLLTASGPTFGQQIPGGGQPAGAMGQPTGYGQPFVPAAFQPSFGNQDPNVLYPAGVPQSYQPWPAVSPYQSANVASDQHYNSNGLWFRRILHRNREYFASFEVMSTWYRDAGQAGIGSPTAIINPATDVPQGQPVNGGFGAFPSVPNFTGGVQGYFAVDPGVFPFPALAVNAAVFVNDATAEAYPIHSASVLADPDAEPGLLGRFGFFNEDDTGMQISGFWAAPASQSFQRGFDTINGVPVTQDLTSLLNGQNLTPRNGVIPLDNGEPITGFFDFGTGSTAKYDVLYRLESSTQSMGTNISFYTQPLYRNSGVKIRPLWGLRYLYIDEHFGFRGIDSGFNYDVDSDNDDESTFRPEGTTATRIYDQYEATLNHKVQSQLAGPEIGLRFDLGGDGDGFKMWGESIFGLAANYEEMQLTGNNIGDPLVDFRVNGNDPPRMLDPNNVSEFSDSKSNTHVSPMFQQSIFADVQILDVVPVINKMEMFEAATFRIGYTLTYVGHVARPADSTEWRGFPLYPRINTNYKNWWMQQLHAGIDWRF